MGGQQEEGITKICQSLATIQNLGQELLRPYFLALLAEAYEKNGQAEEGLTALAEALAIVEKNAESQYEAELYRLKGQLLQDQGADAAEVEGCFHQALSTARRQSAKSLELRAAMSLSRLWRKRGKKEEARKLLQEIYDWFTEGFDTADLKEAKAFLQEIS
jgi:predicted ATPase